MSDNIEYNGSWAQPEVIEDLKNQEVIASDSTGAEAVAISNAIGAFSRAYAGNAGLTAGINQRTVRIFNGVKWAPVTVVINYIEGDNQEKAIAKAIAGIATTELLALATAAVINPATAPFAFAIGTTVVGYFAAAFVLFSFPRFTWEYLPQP